LPIVYQAVNTVNGKRYIGATKFNLARRKRQHLSAAKTGVGGCPAFARALKKYGSSAFRWECIGEYADVASAFGAEKALIAATQPEYNIASGGDAYSARSLPLDWAHWNRKAVICTTTETTYESTVAAARALNISYSHIATLCKTGRATKSGLAFRYASGGTISSLPYASSEQLALAHKARLAGLRKSHAKISYAIMCKTDGREFKSICEAGRYYGIPFSSISSAIKREGTTHELSFRMVDPSQSKVPPIIKKKPFRRKVVCIDTGEAFNSLAEAGRHYGVSDSHICEVCTGRRVKTAKGLSFKYAEAA